MSRGSFISHMLSDKWPGQTRMIWVGDVRNVVERGELVEDYPEDVRGHSCLILNYRPDGTPIHVVCSPKDDYLTIITAYIPNIDEWERDYKQRKKR